MDPINLALHLAATMGTWLTIGYEVYKLHIKYIENEIHIPDCAGRCA